VGEKYRCGTKNGKKVPRTKGIKERKVTAALSPKRGKEKKNIHSGPRNIRDKRGFLRTKGSQE